MNLYDLAVLLDVEHEPAFFPTTLLVNGAPLPVTRCNSYARIFCAALGVPLAPMTANALRDFLSTSPDWTLISQSEAVTRANAHELVLAVIEEQPHGHVSAFVESPAEDPMGAYVSTAGGTNHIRCRLAQSFGNLSPSFYLFNKPLP